jgi:hypothetical protein
MNDSDMEIIHIIIDAFMIFWVILNPAVKRLHNTIKLLDVYIQAIDRGIEVSLKNGYGEARDRELKRLIDKEKFKRSV